jgi:Protein of unknown function (DUF3179)
MRKFLRSPYLWVSVCFVASLFLLAYPLYVIQPFRAQGPRELMVALSVIRVRTLPLIVLALLAALLSVRVWRTRRTPRARIAAVTLAVLTVASAIAARINVYEKMFHPMDSPVFSAASRSKLDGGEQVIAVKLANSARAYPIRIISYHHIVNDVVAGVPIVATY